MPTPDAAVAKRQLGPRFVETLVHEIGERECTAATIKLYLRMPPWYNMQ